MQPDGVGALNSLRTAEKKAGSRRHVRRIAKTSAAALSDPGGRDYFADRRGGAGYSQHSLGRRDPAAESYFLPGFGSREEAPGH